MPCPFFFSLLSVLLLQFDIKIHKKFLQMRENRFEIQCAAIKSEMFLFQTAELNLQFQRIPKKQRFAWIASLFQRINIKTNLKTPSLSGIVLCVVRIHEKKSKLKCTILNEPCTYLLSLVELCLKFNHFSWCQVLDEKRVNRFGSKNVREKMRDIEQYKNTHKKEI